MSLLPTRIDGLKSFYIKGENFKICINVAEKPFTLTEDKNQRWRTLFYYVVNGGQGKISDKNNPSNYEELIPKKFFNSSKFIECETVLFEATTSGEIIGFNSDNENDTWEGELLDNTLTSITCDFPSVVVCFDGEFVINQKTFKKYNFANLEPNIEYELQLNGNVAVGLFKLTNGI